MFHFIRNLYFDQVYLAAQNVSCLMHDFKSLIKRQQSESCEAVSVSKMALCIRQSGLYSPPPSCAQNRFRKGESKRTLQFLQQKYLFEKLGLKPGNRTWAKIKIITTFSGFRFRSFNCENNYLTGKLPVSIWSMRGPFHATSNAVAKQDHLKGLHLPYLVH